MPVEGKKGGGALRGADAVWRCPILPMDAVPAGAVFLLLLLSRKGGAFFSVGTALFAYSNAGNFRRRYISEAVCPACGAVGSPGCRGGDPGDSVPPGSPFLLPWRGAAGFGCFSRHSCAVCAKWRRCGWFAVLRRNRLVWRTVGACAGEARKDGFSTFQNAFQNAGGHFMPGRAFQNAGG